MTITGGTALSKDDISHMVQDAEKFASEDHQRREAAEARNAGDQLSYQVDKSLEEWGDKVPVLLDGDLEICHYYLDHDAVDARLARMK